MRATLVLAVCALVCALLPASVNADLDECRTRVTSLPQAAAAVAAAAPGAVICLADGSYGAVTLDADKKAPGVTLRAEHPGRATIAGASVDGSHLTIARFRIVGTYDVAPGSRGMTAAHNFFDLDAYTGDGVMACGSTETTCDDVSIVANRFVGRAEEDTIRANRYHDGPDADAYGLLIEGNEFVGTQETGDHNAVFKSVWVGDGLAIRRNRFRGGGVTAPVARFSAPQAPRAGQPVTLDAAATTCDDAPCTYAWSDEPPAGGAWPLGTGATLRYTFTGAGTKHVTLRVTDANGDVGRIERDVVVAR